jgi:hypothetical protein
MLEALIKSIEGVFLQFSVSRALYLAFITIVAIASLYIFDRTTGYSTYARIDRQLTAIERMKTLEDKGVSASPQLAPMFNNVVQQLKQEQTAGGRARLTPEAWIKAAGAAFFPFLFVFVALVQRARGVPDWHDMLIGALVLGAALALVGSIIPTWRSPWLNATLALPIQLIVILAVGKLITLSRRRPSNLSPPAA